MTTNNDDLFYQGRAMTNGDAITPLLAVPLPLSTTMSIEGTVVARRTNGAASNCWKLTAIGTNVDGKAQLAGQIVATGEIGTPYTATFAAQDDAIRVQVKGATDHDVTWHATICMRRVDH